MIERKRRNDFVRKREFDMLRRVRREGLSPEQLAALGTSSRLDDSEARLPEPNSARTDGVKAKIDEIEQQMVGDAGFNTTRTRKATGLLRPQRAGPLQPRQRFRWRPRRRGPGRQRQRCRLRTTGTEPCQALAELPPAAAPSPVQVASGLPPLAPLSTVSFASGLPPLAPMSLSAARSRPSTSAARLRWKSARSCTTPNSTRP
jgi:hypothetical protein